ncbi:hypothetical protein B2G71_11080 [Novosphingobium sp. PC22D]|uniref:DUF2721 domain-containing protein n=1 Tax=Novosphingobium sp. PC22D TaxID=1962403 RepID=UPI000BF20A78|nr:DUF2721 domain-containing protein [Novosphingobium sp. PC22D]PEQ12824.1 hypothetical protein B2G71_11080 [Novosphingobium sp. PC22D]
MIAQTIQLALTPVFMLVAIGNILNLLSTRLARIVDRARALQEKHQTTTGPEHDVVVQEIRLVDRRIRLGTSAIRLLVISGVFVGATVVLLFLEETAQLSLQLAAAGTFTLALGMLMTGLVLFLLETQISAAALRIPRDLLELEREI